MKIKKLDSLVKPYHIYAETLDPSAIEQFIEVMKRPDILKGALMPDCHKGYVMPIGGVVASKGTIYPSFVGYDIGCGMFALPLDIDPEVLKEKAVEIREAIFKEVPVGFGKNNQEQAEEAKGYHNSISLPFSKEVQSIVDYGPFALGTLGGGNHFIEIGISLKNQVWIIIHTGSRSVGHGIGSFYMKLAAGEGNQESICSFESESPEGQAYIQDMNYALTWAKKNRSLIMYRVKRALESVVGPVNPTGMLINRNHNHAELKDGLWIHRKGATHAEEGMWGVIPGNMRDGCFIVVGKGNPDSLSSSSHGAGRVMSRAKAKKLISFDEFKEAMKDIPGATVRESTIDESPFAYKDIWEVMRLQEDLVTIEEYIKPVVNVKG